MFRLVLAIFRIMPWWGYAAVALVLANATYALWQSHSARMSRAETAILAGPPQVQKVGDYAGYLPGTDFGEVRLAGFVRADLGAGRLDGTVPKTYVVLDGPERTGPLVAVMFIGTEAQEGLPELVASAQESGLVMISGFRRTLDWAEVSGQLRLSGVRREVLLVEALVGDRDAALREKGQSELPFLILAAAAAALSGLVAFVKRTVSTKRQPANASAPPKRTARSGQKTNSRVPTASPWGTFKSVTRTAAPPPTPATPPRPPAAATAQNARLETALPSSPLPEFESVFPGGGSGFRFKTADEIIRQSFGTVTNLDRPQRPKED